MDSINVNTNTLSNVVSDLSNIKKYYNNKKNTFYSGAFSSTSKLSTYLEKVRNNYVDITNNIARVSEYLEDYYKDIEGLENKFSSNTGSIKDSSTSSVASKYASSLVDYSLDDNDLFQINVVDESLSVSNAVSDVEDVDIVEVSSYQSEVEVSSIDDTNAGILANIRSFIANIFKPVTDVVDSSIETEQIVIDDPLYQNTLDAYMAQLEYNEEVLNEYINASEECLNQYSDIENQIKKISNAYASGKDTTALYEELQTICEADGFTDYANYLNWKEEVQQSIINLEYALYEIEQYKNEAQYEVIALMDEYNEYVYVGEGVELDSDILTNIVVRKGGKVYYSYDKYVSKYGSVSRYEFLLALTEWDVLDVCEYSDEDELLVNLIKASEYDPELATMYNYLFDTYGGDVADQYLDDMESTVNNILGCALAEEWLDNLSQDGSFDGAVINEAITTVSGIYDGLNTFYSGIDNAKSAIEGLFTDNNPSRSYTVEEYRAMYIVQGLSTGEYDGVLLANNYEISEGIGNMIPSILLSSVSMGLGNTALGISSGGNAYHSALVGGSSNTEALLYGAISGATEAITERYLGGLPGLSEVKVTSAETFIKAMLKEGNEEFYQEWIDAFASTIILGEDFDLSATFTSSLKAWTYGAITAGVLQGATVTSGYLSASNMLELTKASMLDTAINDGVLDMSEVVNALKSSDLDIDYEGKSDLQIVTENYALIYELYEDVLKGKITQDEVVIGKNVNTLSDTKRTSLDQICLVLDNIYGYSGAGLERLALYYSSGDISVIPSDQNCRNYISNYITKNDLNVYLLSYTSVSENVSFSLSENANASLSELYNFYEYYGSANGYKGLYGADQGIISSLRTYYRDGVEYDTDTLNDLMDLWLKNGYDIPAITTKDSIQYIELENKLIQQGFSASEASIILASINSNGGGVCSYASMCNDIFYSFRNNPEAFEETFGYPMYIVTSDGYQTLNSAELLLDLYVYANSVENGGYLFANNENGNISISIYGIKPVYAANSEFMLNENGMYTLSNVTSGRNQSYDLMTKFIESKNSNLEYDTKVIINEINSSDSVSKSEQKKYMKTIQKYIDKGYSLSLDCVYVPDKGDTVIRFLSADTSAYPDVSTANWGEGGGHSVEITGYNETGLIISSWGRKYVIPYEDLWNGGRFQINATKITIEED